MLLFWYFGSILQTDLLGSVLTDFDAADVGALSAVDAVDLEDVPLAKAVVRAERDFDQTDSRARP